MTRAERAFTGWMAPRGIIAAATASTFSAGLAAKGIGGAAKILPCTFLVIVATVGVYGLTAVPVARRLGVARPARSRPLLVGGDPWVVDLARVLRSAGVPPTMWAGPEDQRQRIRQAGLELAPGELLAAAIGRGAELEGITAVYLLTAENDFNALGSAMLDGSVPGATYRLGAPALDQGVVAPYLGGQMVFAPGLTSGQLSDRYARGSRTLARPADGGVPAGSDLLFRVRVDGRLDPVTQAAPPPRARRHDGPARPGQRHAGRAFYLNLGLRLDPRIGC